MKINVIIRGNGSSGIKIPVKDDWKIRSPILNTRCRPVDIDQDFQESMNFPVCKDPEMIPYFEGFKRVKSK